MKKWNKKIENKLQELMMRAYQVTANDINDEIWETNKKKLRSIYNDRI